MALIKLKNEHSPVSNRMVQGRIFLRHRSLQWCNRRLVFWRMSLSGIWSFIAIASRNSQEKDTVCYPYPSIAYVLKAAENDLKRNPRDQW